MDEDDHRQIQTNSVDDDSNSGILECENTEINLDSESQVYTLFERESCSPNKSPYTERSGLQLDNFLKN